ncbi:MAG TPA: hypothetical protein DD621_05800 [Clostridiales bacterium]|nr:hypothetical protein [Clostridiales bacterium]
MKKIIIILIICIVGFFNIQPCIYVKADDGKNVEEQLNTSIGKQLNNIDFSDLDMCLDNLNQFYGFSENNSIKDVVLSIVSGKYFSSYSSILSGVLNTLFSGVKKLIPLMFLIVGVAILGSILNSLKSSNNASSVNDLIHFVCYSAIVLILSTTIIGVIKNTYSTLMTMSNHISIIFPIMLTLLTAVGGVTSVGIYKPVVSILTSCVGVIYSKFLFPLFILSFIFLVVGNLSKNIKLTKCNNFLSTLFKTVIGFTATMFTAFLTIQGISAGKFDGISVKATKFAVKSYIPLIGGFISDGFDLILCSSIIIKNAVGVIGLLIIVALIISPVINILLLKLMLSLTSAILEPVSDGRISDFCSGCSKILAYPLAIILVMAFMYLLSIALIMTTANIK